MPDVSPRPTAAIIRPRKLYLCDCSRFCKGRRTEVSRSTYQRHASFRQADMDRRIARYRPGGPSASSTSSTGASHGAGQSIGACAQVPQTPTTAISMDPTMAQNGMGFGSDQTNTDICCNMVFHNSLMTCTHRELLLQMTGQSITMPTT